MRADFDLVEGVFVDAVLDNAEIKDVSPLDISLILFPQKQKNGKFRLRVAISSKSEAFKDEIVKLRKLTMYDMTGHISKAIMKILEHEVEEHNLAIKTGVSIASTYNFSSPITVEQMECYVEVKKSLTGEWKLAMNLIWNYNFLRKYDLREEFGDIEIDEDTLV